MGGPSAGQAAADQEAALAQKEYDQKESQIQEEREQIDQEEMAYLHSQGGISFDSGPSTANPSQIPT